MSPTCTCCSSSPCARGGISNRPGLRSLAYRAGTYGSFFQAMQERISGSDLTNAAGQLPLSALTTRDPADPAIALLDTWAIVADVLTFYQERIANEAYLRTATERSSVLALAGLVGYAAKPGVSASVFLAYTLEASSSGTIRAGTQAQSKAMGTALPQMFETSVDLAASGAWNNLAPRLTQPQMVTASSSTLYVEGLSPNLKPNDTLLITADKNLPARIATVEPQSAQKRTKITLQPQRDAPPHSPARALMNVSRGTAASAAPQQQRLSALDRSVPMLKSLFQLPAEHPSDSQSLARSVANTFASPSDTAPALLKAFFPRASADIYTALRNSDPIPSSPTQVFAFRVQATPFGSNAPQKSITTSKGAVIGTEEWPIGDSTLITISLPTQQEPSRILSASQSGAPASFGRVNGIVSRVTISLGAISSSADVPVEAPGATPTAIGSSTVVASTSPNLDTITWTFTAPNRTFTLSRSFVNDIEQAAITVDSSTLPITVSRGQSASLGGPAGKRTTVTFARTLVISDTNPNPSANLAVLDLDATYDHILPDSWVVIHRADTGMSLVTQVDKTEKLTASSYNISGHVTRLTLKEKWLTESDVTLSAIRHTTILAQSEALPLAEEPIPEDVAGLEVELDNLYEGLTSGRWLIVQGTRTDIPGTTGVQAAELVMLLGIKQQVKQAAPSPVGASVSPTGTAAPPIPLPGDRIHTTVQFARKLSYTYDRSSVSISGNVVQATHGMTRSETLGSGDSSQILQKFSLHQAPVTYLSASTPQGAESTLSVTVNDLKWTELDSLDKAGPADRAFVTQRDDHDMTSILFGDGVHGMRPPTGTANIAASYRAGIGAGGNLPANQISLLASRPPGVRSVTNPIASSGGADRETIDSARANTPLTISALDRLVSVPDYADFARSFAGISKATSARLSNGRQSVVSVTVAGMEAGNLDPGSALFKNLRSAFQEQGDPNQPLNLDICEFMLLVLSAQVRPQPEFQWPAVSTAIRSALLDAFGFREQEIGESIPESRVVRVIQSVAGVQYVNLTTFDSISQAEASSPGAFRQKLSEISASGTPKASIQVLPPRFNPTTSSIAAGQLAFLSADVPDTLILTEVTA